ncbi:hypothetical protein EV363DRAFT_1479243 [Boletus edulis]|nr:hypothetical protein EV363DRAFT_1479243 [Boletus edulis]
METCAEHKVSLSTVLQEAFIADHTPMYWAIVNYRQELLVALLVHSRPLSIQTVSDIRRACLVTSNQALFHALRTCRYPFHGTDGIQAPSLRTASDNLLLGNRPMDEICIQQASDQTFVVSFDIHLWQKRMKAVGQVGFEFIASSRIWSVTFFSTDPGSPVAASGKSRRGTNAWHVMISLMESSSPTFFDSRLVVDVPLPLAPEPIQTPRLREARSTTFPSSTRNPLPPFLEDRCPSFNLPPPTHPLRCSLSSPRSSTATTPPISIQLGCGNRQLGRRASAREPMEIPATRPDTWSDHGQGYTNAIVAPLGEGLESQLLYEHSRYLLPDGTLRGRLEARLVKTESSKDCIIC